MAYGILKSQIKKWNSQHCDQYLPNSYIINFQLTLMKRMIKSSQFLKGTSSPHGLLPHILQATFSHMPVVSVALSLSRCSAAPAVDDEGLTPLAQEEEAS